LTHLLTRSLHDALPILLSEVERTGLFDSLKTTADYNASINGISLTGSAVRRLADAGLFFFREGEQMTRGYGYLLARDLFMKGKPDRKSTRLNSSHVKIS